MCKSRMMFRLTLRWEILILKPSGILDSKLEALSLLEIIMTEHQPHIETNDQGKYNEMPEMAKRERENTEHKFSSEKRR